VQGVVARVELSSEAAVWRELLGNRLIASLICCARSGLLAHAS